MIRFQRELSEYVLNFFWNFWTWERFLKSVCANSEQLLQFLDFWSTSNLNILKCLQIFLSSSQKPQKCNQQKNFLTSFCAWNTSKSSWNVKNTLEVCRWNCSNYKRSAVSIKSSTSFFQPHYLIFIISFYFKFALIFAEEKKNKRKFWFLNLIKSFAPVTLLSASDNASLATSIPICFN